MEINRIMDKDLPDDLDLDLKENDINVLSTIDEERLTNFAFEGLKRRMGIHPETLSRILNRLTQQEIIRRGTKGYTLTPKAKKVIKSHKFDTRNPTLQILQTLLPIDVPIQKIISNLKGKWFGQLRWLGYSASNENVNLKWITDDGGTIISAIFYRSKLHINAKMILSLPLFTIAVY